MFGSYFNTGQQGLLATAFLLAVLAMIFHGREREKTALVLLLSSALAMRLFAAFLDPYLNMWDESVHALVAKNMSQYPLTPMLFREEALDLTYTNWTENHIWLHKQPFFLWVMALSIKVFGPTVFAVRFPSAVFSVAWVFFTHGIAHALYGRRTAFIAALLMTFTNWTLSQVAGFEPTDHNDSAFVALVGGSLWAWYAVLPRSERRGVLLIGVFAGCAVLTKWLTGLLVFAGWGATVLVYGSERWARIKLMVRALCIATVIAAPWQIYAWARFPVEMSNEMSYNARHFCEVLEGNGGTENYYFDRIAEKLFPFDPYLFSVFVLLGLFSIRRRDHRLHALITVVGLFEFFTVAASKMGGYILPILPYFLTSIAYCIDRCAPEQLGGKWPDVVRLSAAGFLAGMLLNIPQLQIRHTAQCRVDPYFARYVPARLNNLASLHELDHLIGDTPRAVVFHVPYPENLNLAYFHGHEGLSWMPSIEYCERLHAAGCSLFLVDPPEGGPSLPAYVRVIHRDRPMFLPCE